MTPSEFLELLAVDEDIGKAGPVGLFLILSLLIVVFFLGRSMRTHLRRVPHEFPDTSASQAGDRTALEGDVLEGDVIEGEVPDHSEDSHRGDGDGLQRPGTSGPGLV